MTTADKTSISRRYAKDYVDACRTELDREIQEIGVPRGDELELSLHKSISSLLHQEVARLEHYEQDSKVLPSYLHDMIGEWKQTLGENRLEALVKVRASAWKTSLVELCQRLAADRSALIQRFGIGVDARLCFISAPLGDIHNNGRSVFKLTFDDGATIIYKPRSVDGEEVFGHAVRWLGDTGFDLSLRRTDVLSRKGYGWTSFVDSRSCGSPDDAVTFYRRQGAFLALFFLLCGSDCIDDNVLVADDHPVWIDTECLLRPRLTRRLLANTAPMWLETSALSTSMIFYCNDMGLRPREHTALAMSCMGDRAAIFDDADYLRAPYVDAVLDGFRRAYSWILDRKDVWTSATGILALCRGKRIRVIPRSTAFYVSLVDALQSAPEHLNEVACDTVERVLRGNSQGWNCPDLLAAEMTALKIGDVPYTSTLTDSFALDVQGWPIEGLIEQTGMEQLHARAASMNQSALETQVFLIEAFLRMKVPVS